MLLGLVHKSAQNGFMIGLSATIKGGVEIGDSHLVEKRLEDR